MMLSFPHSVAIILVISSGGNPISEDNFSTVQASPVVLTESDNYQLPKNVVPVSYKMLFTPDLKDKFTFDGESEIVIKVIAKTNQIVLHANNLTIKSTTLTGPDGESIVAEPAALNTTNDFLVINVGTELLPKTNYTLKFVFEGKLNDDGKGFFRIAYEDDHGAKRWSAATFFEPTSARRAFPCWDEPHLKATFDISIKHHKNLHAISNMHVIATEVDQTDSTHNITTFATTPKMSTYLVAFIITDFVSSSNENNWFRIWTKPSDIQRGNFHISLAERMMNELEAYTGIPYASHGLKKMDAVALYPSGTKYAGMGNWGLVTFKDDCLPITENSDASTGAHIMMNGFAYQWFDNLVTPKWWQYAWLSQGFAKYLSSLITDKIWPQWRYKDAQVVRDLQFFAFSADSKNTAKAMNHDVHSPIEIQEKSPEITYLKAASVIRMIAHVLDEAKFQIAVRNYLNKMKFNAATPDDLFEEFVKVFPTTTGLTVRPIDILKNWVNTPGFPVINVTRDYHKNTMNISQKRFLNELAPGHNETYYVPINYATQGEMNFDDTTVTNWLDKDKPVTEIEGNFKNNEWIIVNKQQFGYYRVNYDEQNWNMIADFLRGKDYIDIPVINRLQLVDDALRLAENGQLRWDVAFNVIQFLKQEVDSVPWYPATTPLVTLPRRFANSNFEQSFKNYIAELTESVLRNITMIESLEDDIFVRENRDSIVYLACYAGSKTCRDEASAEIINWLKDPKMEMFHRFSSHVKWHILCAGIRTADSATWNKLFTHLLAGGDNRLRQALACTSNAEILKQYLCQSIDKPWEIADRQQVFKMAIGQTAKPADLVLDFVIAHADRIYEVSGNSSYELQKYIEWLGKSIGTEEQLNKLENASNEHVKRFSSAGIKAARTKLDWLNLHRKDFEQFFEGKSSILPK